jgi:leucyl/phenylalanyl-tRNA--protein transferase
VHPLDPQLLLRAYAAGIFPMADARDADEVFWVEPRKRGILPLDRFHLPRSLAKLLRQDRFELTVDRAFEAVMQACAEPTPGRTETWINATILDGYTRLHRVGFAHSLECWQDGKLAGGLYGVKLGGAFFGESMFTRVRDASKVALAHLIARLRVGRFQLLDTQFITEHLSHFGAIEVPRATYRSLLDSALSVEADFFALDALPAEDEARPATMVSGPTSGKLIAQLLTQTS